jgi:hypothetical protein
MTSMPATSSTTTSTTTCARCGGTSLIPARLEQSMTFHVDDETRHAVCRVGMRAVLCQDCGHAEFWVMDPARALPCQPTEEEAALQEEDF